MSYQQSCIDYMANLWQSLWAKAVNGGHMNIIFFMFQFTVICTANAKMYS
jgi:hypothetical protein